MVQVLLRRQSWIYIIYNTYSYWMFYIAFKPITFTFFKNLNFCPCSTHFVMIHIKMVIRILEATPIGLPSNTWVRSYFVIHNVHKNHEFTLPQLVQIKKNINHIFSIPFGFSSQSVCLTTNSIYSWNPIEIHCIPCVRLRIVRNRRCPKLQTRCRTFAEWRVSDSSSKTVSRHIQRSLSLTCWSGDWHRVAEV